MNQKGFTIIELLVVIGIVAILAVIVISNFSQIKFQLALSRVSYKFNQDIRRAQSMASSAVVYQDASQNEQPVDGYGVYVDLTNIGNKRYIIYADKSPGNEQYDVSDYIIETVDFSVNEPGIIIKQLDNIVGNNTSINFNISDLHTQIHQLNSGQNNVNVVFAVESNQTKTKIVSANTFGLIEVE